LDAATTKCWFGDSMLNLEFSRDTRLVRRVGQLFPFPLQARAPRPLQPVPATEETHELGAYGTGECYWEARNYRVICSLWRTNHATQRYRGGQSDSLHGLCEFESYEDFDICQSLELPEGRVQGYPVMSLRGSRRMASTCSCLSGHRPTIQCTTKLHYNPFHHSRRTAFTVSVESVLPR
jgi:hypothetical protein